jgi:hypothetical protein
MSISDTTQACSVICFNASNSRPDETFRNVL